MPAYIVDVRLVRTYEKSILVRRGEIERERSRIEQFLLDRTFPDIPHDDWTVEASSESEPGDRDVDIGSDLVRNSMLREVVLRRPMIVHAANPRMVKTLLDRTCSPYRVDMPGPSGGNGWHMKSQTTEAVSIESDRGQIRTRKSFVVDVQKAIAPDSCLCGLDEEQAFEFFRWMVAASANYSRQETWHRHHAHMSMNALEGTDPDIGPIESEKDLVRRIVRGLLSQGHDLYREWREDHGVTPTSKILVEAPTYGRNRMPSALSNPSGTWKERRPFKMMRAAFGITLRRQLNSFHSGAVSIHGLQVHVNPEGFEVSIRYGYPNERHGSGWDHVLATSRGHEPFALVFDRAVGRLLDLVPDWDEQVRQAHRIPTIGQAVASCA